MGKFNDLRVAMKNLEDVGAANYDAYVAEHGRPSLRQQWNGEGPEETDAYHAANNAVGELMDSYPHGTGGLAWQAANFANSWSDPSSGGDSGEGGREQ